MLRRSIISIAGGVTLGAALPAHSQATVKKVWRIGVLSESLPQLSVLKTLKALDYEEGRNLVIDYKFARGRPELLDGLAAELLAAKPDLLIAPLNTEAAALKRATSSIPIMMLWITAPVELGLVASMARPGGNLTGTTTNPIEMAGKMVQLLRETIPRSSRIVMLNDPSYPGMTLYLKSSEQAASAMGIQFEGLAVRTLADLDMAFAALKRNPPDGIMVSMTGVILGNVQLIVEFTALHKLPALYSIKRPVMIGGLMSLSPDFGEMGKRQIAMIDKLLKGAKPSEMPIEQPTNFELAINMKTARAMGLTIPPAVMLQATELIE